MVKIIVTEGIIVTAFQESQDNLHRNYIWPQLIRILAKMTGGSGGFMFSFADSGD
jgi:hypothetical protein